MHILSILLGQISNQARLSFLQMLKFKSIRVDNPVVMAVNKRKIGADKLAFSVLSVTNKSD